MIIRGIVKTGTFCVNGYSIEYKENKATATGKCDSESKKYTVYENGTAIYFNPGTNSICTETEASTNLNENGTPTEIKTGCMKWYTFNDSETSSTVNMILDHNTTARVYWNSTGDNTTQKEVAQALTEDTTNWDSSLNARLISADEVATITGNTSFNSANTIYSGWFYLDSNSQTQTATSQGASKYAWLYDNLWVCTSSGCDVEDNYTLYGNTSIGGTWGYWTSTSVYNNSAAVWNVYRDGTLGATNLKRINNDVCGARPVITVLKSKIS